MNRIPLFWCIKTRSCTRPSHIYVLALVTHACTAVPLYITPGRIYDLCTYIVNTW
jgi:hypothetical protein